MANKKRSHNEGSIKERKDGRFEVRMTVGRDFKTGKPKRVSKYAANKPEAVGILQKSAYDIRIHGYKDPTVLTVSDWLNFWLETYMKNSLKRSTYINYQGHIKNHYETAIGIIKLKNLTTKMLQDLYNYKYENGLSAKTIHNMNNCFHKALSQAVKEGLLIQNVCDNVTLPRQKHNEIEVLDMEQHTKLVQASYNHRYGVFVRFTLGSGLRLGELLALKWEDINLSGSVLTIRRTINRLNTDNDDKGSRTEIVFGEPKTKNSIRQIPLNPNVVQDLLRWKQVQEKDKETAGSAYTDQGFLVTNPLGGFIEQRTFKDYYDRMLKDADIGHFTFHALRHTFSTRALERGMDPKTLSEILGHYSVSFTLDTYTHVLDEQKRRGMALMSDIYDIPDLIPEMYKSYPLLFTPHEGNYVITSPDFPKCSIIAESIDKGLKEATEILKRIIKTFKYPPAPSKVERIEVANGSFVVVVGI